jgi:hypothetical protein
MAVEMLAPSTKTLRRRNALEPYLVKLDAALGRLPVEGVPPPLKLNVGDASLVIESWVSARADARNAFDDEDDQTELLRQSLALWLKGSVDIGNLREGVRSGAGNLYELQAELMLDSAFGSALLRDIQDGVDNLVKNGELEEAKRFSKFQHQMRCVVREIKQSVAASNGNRADDLADQPTDHQPAKKVIVESALPEVERETPAPRRRPRPPAETSVTPPVRTSPPRYRTEILIALDVIALIVILFVTGPRSKIDRPARILTHGDFPNAAPLTEIVARPPALYAVVDEKTWSGYDDAQKRRFIDGIGSVLLTKSYGGFLLKTPDGRIVGEWLETGGTRLLEPEAIVRSEPSDPSLPAASVTRVDAEYSRFVP